MKKKVPKTSGFQWVEYSLIAFNGSGYASRETAEAFVDSYIDYNKWKNRPEAVRLANQFYKPLLVLAEQLLPSEVRKPSNKNWAKFQASRNKTQLL